MFPFLFSAFNFIAASAPSLLIWHSLFMKNKKRAPTHVQQNTAPEDNELPTVVSVHFPGVLRKSQNPTNAIAALGGQDAVRAHVTAVAALSGSDFVKVPPLTLSLRPGDATSSSNIQSGEPRPTTTTFALRVHRAPNRTQHGFSSSQVQLHGRVEHVVPFPGIADWAYIGDRTLDAAAKAVEKRPSQEITDDYSNAPDHLLTGPRKRRRTSSWRPRLQCEMRTQRAVDIVEFVRTNLCAPPPKKKPTTQPTANNANNKGTGDTRKVEQNTNRGNSGDTSQVEEEANASNTPDASTAKRIEQNGNESKNPGSDAAKEIEQNSAPGTENGDKNVDDENEESNLSASNKESGCDTNAEKTPKTEDTVQGSINVVPQTTSTTEGPTSNSVGSENQLRVMELCRPWRFSRTGIELAQTDYFFQQQSYQRESLVHSAFQLGQDRRSDSARLSNKPWKVAANKDEVPSYPPTPAQLRVRSFGRPLAQRRVQNRELLYADLKRLFNERPVWVKRNVCQHVKPELRGSFVHVARRVAYSFYGPSPFIQAWMRYGYDPRADRGARGFQVIDLRLNNPVVVEAVKVQYQRVKAPLSPKLRLMAFEPDYTLAQVPTYRHMFLQLCDIQIPAVQKLVVEEKFPEKYDPKYGFFTEQGHVRVVKAIRKGVYEMAVEMLGEARAKHIVEEYIRVRRRRRWKLKHLLGDDQSNKDKKKQKPNADLALINPAAAAKVDLRKGKSAGIRRITRVPEIEAGPVDVRVTPVNQGAVLDEGDPPVVVVAQRLSDGEAEGEAEGEEEDVKLMNFEDVECFEVMDEDDDEDEDREEQDADDSDDGNWLDEE